MRWEDEPTQAVEATGPHSLHLGTAIPKASHRLWAFGSGATEAGPARWCCDAVCTTVLAGSAGLPLEQDSRQGAPGYF